MTGQDEIIALRCAGFVPMIVWQDGDEDFWRKIIVDNKKFPEVKTRYVLTKTTESTSGMDLRFLVNLPVLVFSSGDELRANRLRDAVISAKATSVLVTSCPRISRGYEGCSYITHQKKGGKAICQQF
ncbi:MAG: hypothetical protein RL535_1114 [Pseudomonadota bacterium]|jgi:hypothetical protein